jgi:hypothetical protein
VFFSLHNAVRVIPRCLLRPQSPSYTPQPVCYACLIYAGRYVNDPSTGSAIRAPETPGIWDTGFPRSGTSAMGPLTFRNGYSTVRRLRFTPQGHATICCNPCAMGLLIDSEREGSGRHAFSNTYARTRTPHSHAGDGDSVRRPAEGLPVPAHGAGGFHHLCWALQLSHEHHPVPLKWVGECVCGSASQRGWPRARVEWMHINMACTSLPSASCS